MPFDPTSILKDWGVTLSVLGVIAGIATLAFIFSLREFAYWFLRINKVMKKQDEVMAKLNSLEALLKKDKVTKPASSPVRPDSDEAETLETKEFPIAKAESSSRTEFNLLN